MKQAETDVRYIYDYKLQIPAESAANNVRSFYGGRRRRSVEEFIGDEEDDIDRIRRQSTGGATSEGLAPCMSTHQIRREKSKKRLDTHKEQSKQRREEVRQRREEVVGAAQQRREKLAGTAQKRREQMMSRHEEVVGSAQQRREELKQRHVEMVGAAQQRHEELVGAAKQRHEEMLGATQQRREKMRTVSESRKNESKQRREQMVGASQKQLEKRLEEALSRHEQMLGATQQRHESLRTRVSETTQQHQQRMDEIRSLFRTRTEAAVSRRNEFINGFSGNFEAPVAPRDKRSTPNEIYQMPSSPAEPRPTQCSTIASLKEKSRSDQRLQSPEAVQYMPELQMSASAEEGVAQKHCRQCQAYEAESQVSQPQYFQHELGQLVPYTLGSAQQSYSAEPAEPHYVYDRLGHTYVENDGRLRLMAPQYDSAPEQSGTQFISGVLNENQEVMDELNPFPGTDRMLPPVTDLVKDGVEYLHEIARRDVDHIRGDMFDDGEASDETEAEVEEVNVQLDGTEGDEEKEITLPTPRVSVIQSARVKPTGFSIQKQKNKSPSPKMEDLIPEDEESASTSEEDHTKTSLKTQRMYQVMPFQQDDRDGSMIVKIFSSSDSRSGLGETKNGKRPRNGNKIVQQPKMETVRRGDKEYDVLTIFEDPDANSQEEVQRVIKHLSESRKKASSPEA